MAETIAVFIDGAHFHEACTGLGFHVDYNGLRKVLDAKGRLLRCVYYTVMTAADDGGFQGLRPLVDWLEYNEYDVVVEQGVEHSDPRGGTKLFGSIDTRLAIDAIDLSPSYDHAILVSGRQVFVPLVESLKRRGKRVTVMSSRKVQGLGTANALRRAADHFIEIDDVRPSIARAAKETAA